MLDKIKGFWQNKIRIPLSNLLRPITQLVAKALMPISDALQPIKERFDERWAAFAADHPTIAVWLRRGTKLGAGLYALYFIFAIGLFGEIPTVEELKEMQTLNTSEVLTADSVLIGKSRD